MEVDDGVMGSDIPMAILPGGTGNAMSFEHGIPHDLEQAAELICQSRNQRKIDVVKICDQHFMLRLFTGIEENEKTKREGKNRLGNPAYLKDALKELEHLPHANYNISIDGQQIEEDGVFCLILNAGRIDGIETHLTKQVSVSDELADAFIVNRSLFSKGALASFVFDIGASQASVHHWQAREIRVAADSPRQSNRCRALPRLHPYFCNSRSILVDPKRISTCMTLLDKS